MKKVLLTLLMLASLLACKEAPKDPTPVIEKPLILLNRSVLERVKNDIGRQDAEVMPAYNQLLETAGKMLGEGPFSVMDKKQIPPSGNKHDYVSRGPYWWKNPDTADGLPYIRRDGERNPELDDFSDHIYLSKVCSMVTNLSLAYYFSGDEKYASHAALLLRTWFLDEATKMNPNLNYGQQIPGICEGRGIGIIETPCIAKMLDYEILLQSSEAWTEADHEGFAKWIADYNEWLQTSDNGKDEARQHNNHGTWYDYQIVAFSIFTGQGGKATQQLKEVTMRRMDSQLEADGEQPFEMARTKPWGYCTMNLQAFVDLAIVGERVGVNLWEYTTPKGATLRKAIEWFFPFISGEQTFPKEELGGKRGAGNLVNILTLASRIDTQKYRQAIADVLKFCNDKSDQSTSMLQLTNPIIEGPMLSDEDLFEAINLDYPGLEAVRKAVAAKDYESAKKAFVDHLHTRNNTQWFFDWHDFGKAESRDASFDTTAADKVVNNYFGACRVMHQFGDTIDWAINPTYNKYCEWTWQLSRHPYWKELGKAYWATGDEKYAQAWVKQLRSWLIQCPVPDYSASPDYSRWRTIEAGIRTLYAWPEAFFYFLPSKSFDVETTIWMVKSFYEHGIHLRKYHRKNNWFAMEMNGLFHIGLLLPEFKLSEYWCRYASTKLFEEEKIQFYPDGAQMELAPGYHGVSINSILGIYDIAKVNNYPLPEGYIEGLTGPYEFYQKIMMPDGRMPAVNDSGFGDCRSPLAKGFSLLPNRTDFQYSATGGKEGAAPAYTSVWMPWAGWYMMRSGWGPEDLYAHFEVGPFSPAHSHEDKLSFMIHAFGKRLLTEGGTYDYDTSQWRKYVLSARAHNLSRVDGKDQSRRSIRGNDLILHSHEPMPNRWITNEQFDFGEGWYNEGFGEDHDTTVTQYRALAFIKSKYWILFDVFTPTDQKEHEYQTWFHFDNPEHTVYAPLRAVASKYADNEPNIVIYQTREDAAELKVVTGQEDPEVQGWVPVTGSIVQKCRPVAAPTFIRRQAGQCVEPYILCPVKAGENQPLASVENKDGEIRLTFKDGNVDVIKYSVEGNQLKTLNVSAGGNELKILE